jgi:hypothetical protein
MLNNYKKRIILFFSIILIGFVIYIYQNRQPFIFVDMQYLNTHNIYQSPQELYNQYGLNLTVPLSADYQKVITNYLDNSKILYSVNNNIYEDINLVTRATQYLIQKGTLETSKNTRGITDVLDISGYYSNVCSEAAKISTVFFQVLGYDSRVIWANGHVITEVYDKSTQKWYLVDTDKQVVSIKNDKYISFFDARKDLNNLEYILNSTKKVDAYISILYNYSNNIIILSGKDLFNYHDKFNSIEYIINYIFSLEENDNISGVQLIENSTIKYGNKKILD